MMLKSHNKNVHGVTNIVTLYYGVIGWCTHLCNQRCYVANVLDMMMSRQFSTLLGSGSRFKQPFTDQQNHISQCTVSLNITTHHTKKLQITTVHTVIYIIYPCITRYHHVSQQYISTYLTKNQHPSLLSPFGVICQHFNTRPGNRTNSGTM